MIRRLPVNVKIVPREIKRGVNHVEVRLNNQGDKVINTLEVGLVSLDQSLIEVEDHMKWVNAVEPGKTVTISFTVYAQRSAMVYTRVFGYIDDERHEWQSQATRLRVGGESAELVSLLILGESRRETGETLEAEATIKVLKPDTLLTIDYWVEMPSERYHKIGEVTMNIHEAGEMRHVIEFTPLEEGLYTIYAYLYDRAGKIDQQSDKVYIEKNY
jgi:hypothetical protein